jgi:hypothetical protein
MSCIKNSASRIHDPIVTFNIERDTKYGFQEGFEVFIAVIMKRSIFWDITLDYMDCTALYPRR